MSTNKAGSKSELLAWLQAAPPGTTIPAASIAEQLAQVADPCAEALSEPLQDHLQLTWRERLWLVPAETRLGVREVAEALGRPVSWVYRRTGRGEKAPLPHRKLDGELVFIAGEIRAWLENHETVLVPALRRVS